MFKKISKLILLTVGMLIIFVSCVESKKATPPVDEEKVEEDFVELSAMEGYPNPIIPGMKLNIVDDFRERTSGDLVDHADNETLVYTYVYQPDKFNGRQAVYRYGADQFFGVEVIGEGDSKYLKFIFNKDEGNKSEFFDSLETVDFSTSKTMMTIPDSINNFKNLVVGGGYKFLDGVEFSVSERNMINRSKNTLFQYDDYLGDNKTHAIYQTTSKLNSHQFIGVKLVNSSNPRVLEFYVDGTKENPTFFLTASQVNFNTKATFTLPVTTFLDDVAGKTFQLPINYEGEETQIADNGDIIVDNKLYRYVNSIVSGRAVYQAGSLNKYFGVVVNENKLEFYYDNKSNIHDYWDSLNDVRFTEGADAILAIKSTSKLFVNGVPSGNITDNSNLIPVDGYISAIYRDGTMYIFSRNSAYNQGRLFTGVADEIGPIGASTYVNPQVGANYPNTLQMFGSTGYLMYLNSGYIRLYSSAGNGLSIPHGGYFYSLTRGTMHAVGGELDESFYLASNMMNGYNYPSIRKVTSNGISGTYLYLANRYMTPSSVVRITDEVYVAGQYGTRVYIVTGTGNSSINVANVVGTNGKLFVFNDILYLTVKNGHNYKIYKIHNGETLLVTGAFPTDFEDIVTDDKYVYIISRSSGGDYLTPSVYTLDNITLTKLGDADTINIDGAVHPALVSLGSELGVVIIDVEVIGGKRLLRYNHLMVIEDIFEVPSIASIY